MNKLKKFLRAFATDITLPCLLVGFSIGELLKTDQKIIGFSILIGFLWALAGVIFKDRN